MKLSAQNIAFNEIARRAIKSDPEFFDGNYLQHNTAPHHGLALARMIGHVTYLSDELMGQKFGRELRSGDFSQGAEEPVEFQIESYLNYQGDKFSTDFDANAYILITKMLDYFDLSREYQNDPVQAFGHAKCNFLIISFSSDWRFSPQRSREITDALIAAGKNVSYAEIESDQGHDAFLLPNQRYEEVLGSYLNRVADQLEAASK
jgi:homoserine O-acetyltransferase